ncbi:2-methoxy-6-polyprenyl-1 [Babesia sp. Xinjiang]|uniref:2-methoxy-6-polyprenyl-1 n=1 Tax=Babesia sp. Xinjiang TaxID=462227 RepID=UPI000A23B8FD|nr:2-methoxy-6-polyprenyl-1 [Babesia sp. Xinjiang]ORM39975.1 2-methoxy-6-polyprenyl-1 [Babesia sp. Xinjiang]
MITHLTGTLPTGGIMPNGHLKYTKRYTHQYIKMYYTRYLSVFSGLQGNEQGSPGKNGARLLFSFKDTQNQTKWICSYRQKTSKWKVPNYLQYCGILLLGDHDEAKIDDLVPTDMLQQTFHVFKWECKPDNSSLQESIRYFTATHNSGELKLTQAQIDDIIWVQDEIAEVERRGYNLVATSLFLTLPLQLAGPLELHHDLLGLKQTEQLPSPLQSAVSGFLGEHLLQFLTLDNEALSMGLNDVTVNSATTNDLDYGYAHLAFGNTNCYKKHAVIYNEVQEGDLPDDIADIQVVLQTTCVVSAEHVGDEPTGELADAALQALRHTIQRSFASDSQRNSTKVCITPAIKRVEKDESASNKTSKGQPKGKSGSKGSSKGKTMTQRNKKPEPKKQSAFEEAAVIELLKNVGPFQIAVSAFKRDVYLTTTFDKASGKLDISIGAGNDNKSIEKVRVNIISKMFIPNSDKNNPVIPFGGATLNIFDLLQITGDDVAECVNIEHPATHLKLLLNVKSLVDQNILISCGKNDSGWGCCYRSIQMAVSWYIMQYRTVRPVPTHEEIQRYLQEKDPSHATMVVGSTTWIGTVEAGYFINWYLNYDVKTFYLSDVTEFRNYNGLIAKHFATIGSPIIMGAGMFAYVILGICIGSNAGDVAYLIADPHYVGEDNVKQIQTKGAVAWKKIDFITKAASGSFINLCCPQLDAYDDQLSLHTTDAAEGGNVASKYDLMNDLMSLGVHRLWKDVFVKETISSFNAINKNLAKAAFEGKTDDSQAVIKMLDVAGGTGDISFRIMERARELRIKDSSGFVLHAPNIKVKPEITVLDPSIEMTDVGKNYARDLGLSDAIKWVNAPAEHMPLPDDTYDIITVAFGLRNFSDREQGLRECYRVLKPGGRLMILEFSHCENNLLAALYDKYADFVIPTLGHYVANDRKAYQYLIDSIRSFPTQEELADMLTKLNYTLVAYRNLTGGIVAIHSAFKPQ